ncbi:TetR family transcriptional regulator [Streptomyces calidiresistens]
MGDAESVGFARAVVGFRPKPRAAEVLGERAHQATTIAEIIERAGVTKGALYFHFPSTRALVEAIMAERTSSVASVEGASPSSRPSRCPGRSRGDFAVTPCSGREPG